MGTLAKARQRLAVHFFGWNTRRVAYAVLCYMSARATKDSQGFAGTWAPCWFWFPQTRRKAGFTVSSVFSRSTVSAVVVCLHHVSLHRLVTHRRRSDLKSPTTRPPCASFLMLCASRRSSCGKSGPRWGLECAAQGATSRFRTYEYCGSKTWTYTRT